jgi:carboxypeptidase T
MLIGLTVGTRSAAPPNPGTTSAPNATGTNTGRFYTWPEITRQIDSWKEAYPQLVRQEAIGKTAEGRDIPALCISDHAGRDAADRPQILVMGGIHPREQQPQIAVMRLVGELLEQYGRDDRLTRLVKTRQIWAIPVFNLDGKIFDMKESDGTVRGANWRKNRSKNADGSFGVDLNRNFAIRWGGGSEKPTGNTFQGPAPMSEPETRALADFLESHSIRVLVDMHSHMKAIFHPQYLVEPDRKHYDDLMCDIFALQKTRYRTYTNLPPVGASPPDVRGGDTGLTFAWSYYAAGPYSFNIEIGGSTFYDPPSRIEQEYLDNVREPLLYLIEHCADVPARREGSARFVPDSSQPLLKAASTIHWKPQINGPCDYAVLMSQSPLVTVPSEYRTCPINEGFTLKVSPTAKPGTMVPFKLYLWTRDHARSTADVSLTIATE